MLFKGLPIFNPRNLFPIGGICLAVTLPELSRLDVIDPFLARKLTHLICGVMVMSVEYDIVTCVIMMLIAIGFSALVIVKPPVFAKRGDPGILGFGLVILIYSILQLPPMYLSSLFVADPLGALVGRSTGRKKVFRNKTWIGSSAFAFTSLLLTSRFERDPLILAIVVLGHTIAEMFSPADNIVLGCIGTLHCLYRIHS